MRSPPFAGDPAGDCAEGDRQLRVLFLHYGEFHVNSVIQAFRLGEEMTAAGIEVAFCAQGPPERIETVGQPSFECVNFEGLERFLHGWAGEPEETVICAWTPREVVRKGTEQAAGILDAPYVVHLEEDEEHLPLGRAPASLRRARQAAARPAGPDLHRRLRPPPPTTPGCSSGLPR